MFSLTFRPAAVRQLLRRIYPHKAMGYARTHLRHPALGPVTLAGAVELLESFAYSLIPREAQGLVHYISGLNTELCQAGPVEKNAPAPAHQHPHLRQKSRSAKA
ncbi:hypothetical protein ACFST9_01460 [Hymenobacter monticola]|uniref:Uncharacterized protein n=1 Tax=Hymenobacter monticola TaxID=1705399 RepID=A0ABY4B5U7_9BACT|nr:hypothetical protein [Hymenobacter monticola]UOE33371.1 hypothetical protein MTP16_19870 [Hymenobacter monticola]